MTRPNDTRPILALVDREWFLERVHVSGPDACWEWIGADGYGIAWRGGHHMRAHRLAHELFIGPIPPGAYVLHSCDNPPCCNPRHLRAGDARENARDVLERGRHTSQR